MEMSFCSEQDVMDVVDAMMAEVCATAEVEYPVDVPRITYAEAMDRYGMDAPDMRFGMLLHDVGEIVKKTDFKVFTGALENGGLVKAICPKGGAKFTRKEIDAYTAYAAEFGAKGLAWCKLEGGDFAGGISKFLSDEVKAELKSATGAEEGDILLFMADKPGVVNRVLGELREKLGADLNLYKEGDMAWCWVTDFPLVEWNEDEGRWDSLHHPFTAPNFNDLDKIESDPGSVRSRAYDLVCNGHELGGGSIRIHDLDMQKRVFELLGIGEAEAEEKFSFLLSALKYGAPPHGGVAMGLDRIVMLLTGMPSLRDVIAFPKTQRGTCPLTDAPSRIDEKQLAELDVKLIAPPEEVQ
jgi:aspartyl-tRNA synthetase